jgi:serine phosphatase RsbU (regulator of sigma subunit)
MQEELLARTPILRGLPEKEIKDLATSLRVKEIPSDIILFHEGETGDRFFIVIEGRLEVIKALGTEEERLIGVRGPGEFIGELSLINRTGLRTASIRSSGPVKLWEMSHAEFDVLLHRHPSIAYEILEVLSARLTEAHDASIAFLQEKNLELRHAYEDLKAAQVQIIEKERLEKELQVASEIQRSILPQTLPTLPGYDFGASMMPARAVGGDFYDFFPLGDGKTGIVIGDVADKGVPSAIFMAQTHALIYAEANQQFSPREVLQRVNRDLLRIGESSLFVTVIYGILDGKTGEFSYSRAGHELPIMTRTSGKVELVPHNPGQLLGVLDDPILDEQTVALPPGSTLMLYTDGVLDARDENGNPFGKEQLMATLPKMMGVPAQEACNRLWSEIKEFQGSAPQDDDVTLVAIHDGQ